MQREFCVTRTTCTCIFLRWSIPFSTPQTDSRDFSKDRENSTKERFLFVPAESPTSASTSTACRRRNFSLVFEAKTSACNSRFELLDSLMYSRAGKQLTFNLWILFAKRSRCVRVNEPPGSSQLKDLSLLSDRSTSLITGRKLNTLGEIVSSLL